MARDQKRIAVLRNRFRPRLGFADPKEQMKMRRHDASQSGAGASACQPESIFLDISSATHCFPSEQAQPVHLRSASILARTCLKNWNAALAALLVCGLSVAAAPAADIRSGGDAKWVEDA